MTTVKKQFYLLKASNIATSDVVADYDEVKVVVTGDKVMWADQSVCADTTHPDMAGDGAQFDINQLLEFNPALTGCPTRECNCLLCVLNW